MQTRAAESNLTERQNACLLLIHYSPFFEQNLMYPTLLKQHRKKRLTMAFQYHLTSSHLRLQTLAVTGTGNEQWKVVKETLVPQLKELA